MSAGGANYEKGIVENITVIIRKSFRERNEIKMRSARMLKLVLRSSRYCKAIIIKNSIK